MVAMLVIVLILLPIHRDQNDHNSVLTYQDESSKTLSGLSKAYNDGWSRVVRRYRVRYLLTK